MKVEAPRVVMEIPCEHGYVSLPHGMTKHAQSEIPGGCTGGTRRILDEGTYLLLEGTAKDDPDLQIDWSWCRRHMSSESEPGSCEWIEAWDNNTAEHGECDFIHVAIVPIREVRVDADA